MHSRVLIDIYDIIIGRNFSGGRVNNILLSIMLIDNPAILLYLLKFC